MSHPGTRWDDGDRILHRCLSVVRLRLGRDVYGARRWPDVIFFCLYLCAARRFRLRTGAAIVAMVLSVLATLVIGLRVVGAAGAAVAGGGVCGCQRRSACAAPGGGARPAGEGLAAALALEERHRLDVVRVREHVDRRDAREAVAEVAQLAGVSGERRRIT